MTPRPRRSRSRLPGELLTISGRAFGSSGTVDVGGVVASITDWTADSITVTVPAAARMGPQTLTVHAPYGSSTADLFIGVDFPTGDMAELAVLALPPGTAVRLGEGTYPGGPPGTVVLEGISLYGRGPDQTTLAFGDAVGFEYFAATGQDLEIADLSLVVDWFNLGPGELTMPGTLTPLDFDPGSLTLRNIRLNEASTTPSLAITQNTIGDFVGDLAIIDSVFTAPNTEFSFDINGSLFIRDTAIEAQEIDAYLSFGQLTLHGSELISDGNMTLSAPMGLDFNDAVAQSTSSYVDLMHLNPLVDGARAFPGSSTVVLNSRIIADTADMEWQFGPGTTVLFENSTVQADNLIDITFDDGTRVNLHGNSMSSNSNSVVIGFYNDSRAVLTGNTIESARDTGLSARSGAVVDLTGGNTLTAGSWISLTGDGGRLTASNNRFEVASSIPETVELRGPSPGSELEFHDNVFEWHGSGGLTVYGGGNITLSGNTFYGFENTGTAVSLSHSPGHPAADVRIENNQFTSFENALGIGLAGALGAEYAAAINNNVFDFEMTAAPQVARIVNAENGSLNATHNVWYNFTEVAQVTALIQTITSTLTLDVDPITLP